MSEHFALHHNAQSRKFIVNLLSLEGDEPKLRSCEVTQSHVRNRTSFTKETSLRDVFSDEIAAGLEYCLGKLSQADTEIISLPNLVLEVPGIVLGGAQVLAKNGPDGSLNIIIRFKFFLGGINRVFKHDVGFGDTIDDYNARTSTLVLADIAMPILNLCNAAQAGIFDADRDVGIFVKALSEKSNDIQFQIELIKRYVDGLDRVAQFKQPMLADTDLIPRLDNNTLN